MSVSPTSPLTTRELEVLQRIAEGCANKQIAEQLQITEGTIECHVHNILTKMNAANRAAAVMQAMQRGLLKRDEHKDKSE